MTYYMSSGT